MNEIVCQVISQLLLGNSNLTSVFYIFLIFLMVFYRQKKVFKPHLGWGLESGILRNLHPLGLYLANEKWFNKTYYPGTLILCTVYALSLCPDQTNSIHFQRQSVCSLYAFAACPTDRQDRALICKRKLQIPMLTPTVS